MIVVRVTPANDMRRAFAEWAVEQVPKVRTISSRSFAVPPGQFTALPEYLLIGAMVDGHQYVPVPEDEREDAPAVQAAVPVRECSAKCGGHLPLLPEGAYPPDAVPLDLAPADEDPPHPPPAAPEGAVAADGEAPAPQAPEAVGDPDVAADGPACPDPMCGRTFATARGLAAHHRQAHATETED
ncbi:hypothetical protein [Streptomyces sp. NBC_01207]|uniref:hypothetical protein n=1 Tax=Streptomyces sp. NBC_01207 TaxID=2903772 RepID=UPI002E0FF6BE|nr:hypothetical protein OG457_27475 [Streptomyces sp. NBC_01207]